MAALNLIHFVSDLCIACAGTGCIYLLIAAAAVLRFTRQSAQVNDLAEPVTILKPLQGFEPNLGPRLASFCYQDYAAPVQVVCGVHDPSDPAAEEVKRIAKSASNAADIELVAAGRMQGYCNRKVSNLANMMGAARHDVLVIADSDIEARPGYLTRVVSELRRPGVGAVTCLYHGIAAGGIWSEQAALAINAHFLPSAVVALTFGLAQPCFGSTIALRRSTLCSIGGFAPFADSLADDYAIGMAVRSMGYDVAVPSFSVGHLCFEESLPALVSHEVRAARTIRSADPAGYAGAFITHPFALSLAGVLLGGANAVLFAAAALACRILVCRCVEKAFNVPRQPYWLIPLCDLIAFSAFIAGFLCKKVTWRGFVYDVSTKGTLQPEWSETLSEVPGIEPLEGAAGLFANPPWPAPAYAGLSGAEDGLLQTDMEREEFDFSDRLS